MFTNEEILIHAAGEEFQNTINRIKMYTDKMDDRPAVKRPPKAGVGACRPLMKYPGYVDRRHPVYAPPNLPKIPTYIGESNENFSSSFDPRGSCPKSSQQTRRGCCSRR